MSQVPQECLKHPGFGYCFKQCYCECYDTIPASDPEEDDHEVPHETCVCGHREHDVLGVGYANCPTSGCGSCTMEKCAPCGQPAPKWCYSVHVGTCGANCAIFAVEQMGPMSAAEDGECPICMETKPLYKLKVCGHEFCAPCRGETTDTNRHKYADNRCSICRQENVAGPGEERNWGLPPRTK